MFRRDLPADEMPAIDWRGPPLEAAPGRVARYDTVYQRNGTRNRFMIGEPKRHVELKDRGGG